ncbi:MAG: division/cell wall cluster transcriptional repressor MraZ [Patescibacteria group bacterium]|jgi:MraZ protein
MFIGEYQHSLDEKGRLAIPVKFRRELAKAVVTKGLDDCLVIYPAAEWKKLADKLASLPISQANTRAFSRLMLAGAMDVAVDGQGRVGLPDYLREFAGLNKKVIITGLYNRVEIWDQAKWEKYRQGVEGQSGEIAEKLGELGV